MFRRLWAGWKRIGRKIGDFQSRLLLSLFYFVVIAPFALGIRWGADPLAIKPRTPKGWRLRPRGAGVTVGRASAAVLMNILGISSYFHDAAAALVQDGRPS